MVFTEAQKIALAQIEKDMREGRQPFVICPKGNNWAFTIGVITSCGHKSGGKVTDNELNAILAASLEAIDAEIASRK